DTRQATESPKRSPLANHRQRDDVERIAYAAKSSSVGSTSVLISGYQPKARLENVNSTTASTPQARAPATRAVWRYTRSPSMTEESAETRAAHHQEDATSCTKGT